jgi:hypothetical protein
MTRRFWLGVLVLLGLLAFYVLTLSTAWANHTRRHAHQQAWKPRLACCDPRPTPPTPVPVPDALPDLVKDWIAGLFFERGPYLFDDGPPLERAAMLLPGPVTIVLGSGVDAGVENALRTAADLLPELTCGKVSASFVRDPRAVPSTGVNVAGFPLVGPLEFVLAVVDFPASAHPTFGNGGTATYVEQTGEIVGALAVMQPNGPNAHYVHDLLGHGFFRLAHLDATKIGGTAASIMSFWTNPLPDRFWQGSPPPPYFTALDRQAVRAVYCSGVGPGATYEDFQRAGLVR